ncbi:MAG: sigma-54-dependent Fis family transcriptional regulator [Deltaproteobacteria bacterium]|nr:MAG: sigma-54-dependent Fis family transcriptional regulator [Deltaproteobacteria bacterium]
MNYDILIADDNEDLRVSIAEALQKKSLSCFSAADGEAALQAVRNNNFTVALVDLKMPKKTGIEILQEIKSLNPRTQVVLMTAFGSVESAIQALRLEAADYLLKPFSLSDLEQHVEDLLRRYQLQKTETLPSILKKNDFIGHSESLRRVQQLIKKVAPTSTPVLILGESGTGKGCC